jgi:5-methylcytosine-specific restriction endonuclease McrA
MLKKGIFIFPMMAALLMVCSSCVTSSGLGNGGSGTSNAEPNWGVQTKTTGCVAQGALPDSACTPGAIFPNVTKEQVCVPGYARSVRNVPQSEKKQVFAEYGITKHPAGAYEVDHLVSLELGGSNEIANLWPEAATPKPGFHEKDRVENYLHTQVCNGSITLKQAQIEIATNWLNVYHSMAQSNQKGQQLDDPEGDA